MKEETRTITPNEMFDAAKKTMLDGRDPKTRDEWVEIVNFVAFNTAIGVEVEVARLFRVLYKVPLSEEDVVYIAEAQNAYKIGKIATN